MPGLVEIGLLVLEWKMFKLCHLSFLLFQYYLQLEKGVTLHLKKNLNTLHQRFFVSSLVDISIDKANGTIKLEDKPRVKLKYLEIQIVDSDRVWKIWFVLPSQITIFANIYYKC